MDEIGVMLLAHEPLVGRSPLSPDLLESASKSMILPQTGHHKAFMDVFYS